MSRFGVVEWEGMEWGGGGGGEWIPGHYLVFRRREGYVSYNKGGIRGFRGRGSHI